MILFSFLQMVRQIVFFFLFNVMVQNMFNGVHAYKYGIVFVYYIEDKLYFVSRIVPSVGYRCFQDICGFFLRIFEEAIEKRKMSLYRLLLLANVTSVNADCCDQRYNSTTTERSL